MKEKLITFQIRLTELIEYSGKTQKAISERIGVSKQKFSRWKTGFTEPKIEELILIAKYFNVSTDYLLGLEN